MTPRYLVEEDSPPRIRDGLASSRACAPKASGKSAYGVSTRRCPHLRTPFGTLSLILIGGITVIYANAGGSRPRLIARSALVVATLAAALSLASTEAATAQASFQANVTFTGTRPAGLCANGAYLCGTANIAGHGAASWNMYVTGNTSVPTPCGSSYTAVTDFSLNNDPSSTLVLDEGGSLCGLGHDGAAYRGYFAEGSKAFGHPFAIVGTWTVDATSTGQFSGLAGSGTDLVKLAGAHAAGSYSGTLG